MTPEQKARVEIDKRLSASGWLLQDKNEFNPAAATGVAVREFYTDTGPVDYLLFVDRKPVGMIEAKKAEEGQNITTHEKQSKRYIKSGIKWAVNGTKICFAYEATSVITRFTDYSDEKARSREVFSFHRPETLREWLGDDSTLRNRMKAFPKFDTRGFRICQTKAILGLEKSFGENRPRSLIQMATGAGKTYAAITAAYRLLKFARAKRVLFLVDTRNLGIQAESEFRGFLPNDDHRLFPELYDVHRLNSPSIPASSQVCISTIQRMYSILRGEELDEKNEEENPNEFTITGNAREVVYNEKYPPEYFDFIIIDECHRSIYNIWQQVLDYFDAFQIGLTATPDKRTFGYFQENVVSEYSHEEAVLDNVNVGFDTFIIETEITKKGATLKAFGQSVERRERLTRARRWETLDEDVTYANTQLDRDVVNVSQIRTVIRTFKDKVLSEIFPGRLEVPKTLIFAKTDSHADDIIQIVRNEFGEGNDFCQKITYSVKNPEKGLSDFRNSYYPRIAVTVDMIAAGIDVKPLECLLFMRDVRSQSYFTQMKGRGTRTLLKDDLQKVTPSAADNKARFVIVDAVGVTQSLKTDTRPLERMPTVSLKDLMMGVVMGAIDENTLTSLANRLTRLDKQLTPEEQTKLIEVTKGITLSTMARNLLNSFDEDFIDSSGETQEELIEIAVSPFFDPNLREHIEAVRKAHDQIIDKETLDKVTATGWSGDQEAKANEYIASFRKFIEDNKDEITALAILFNGTWKTRPLTLAMIEEVHEALIKVNISTERLWSAYGIIRKAEVKAAGPLNKLIDIVLLLRFELGISSELTPYSNIVNFNFMRWTLAKNAGNIHFTEEQMVWLRMVKDFIAESMAISPYDLDLAPFNRHGGLGKFYDLFGDGYEALLDEMNLALAV
ncbi:MAG: DEAD/DEAH box helicase family protein [Treponema sp.]|nr:DEAD/DEAH box helicase family protein [Treponema sp.]